MNFTRVRSTQLTYRLKYAWYAKIIENSASCHQMFYGPVIICSNGYPIMTCTWIYHIVATQLSAILFDLTIFITVHTDCISPDNPHNPCNKYFQYLIVTSCTFIEIYALLTWWEHDHLDVAVSFFSVRPLQCSVADKLATWDRKQICGIDVKNRRRIAFEFQSCGVCAGNDHCCGEWWKCWTSIIACVGKKVKKKLQIDFVAAMEFIDPLVY